MLFLAFLMIVRLYSNAQLPTYLKLENPKILNACITSGGRVWNTSTKEIVLSVNNQTSLTLSSIYFSDNVNTYIHSNTDGHFIAQIPGRNYNYNVFISILWKYLNNSFSLYSEAGQLISSFNVSANNIYPFQNEIRYTRSNSIYKYVFTSPGEQVLGDFAGTFSTWFLDGNYFLTTQGTVVRLYDRNATLIKIIDVPSAENIGGNGNYFWIYPNSTTQYTFLNLYKVNENASFTYPTGTSSKIFATPKSIAILKFGVEQFSMIALADTEPVLTSHKGAGPYLKSYDADRYGNWTTANESGVVNFGTLTTQPEILNLGSIRSIFGNENGNLAVATSSGHVLVYNFSDSVINHIDTLDLNVSKVKLSQDGKYLAANGNTFDAQYSNDELSLYVYDIASRALVKKWYYNYFHDNTPYLKDFDFSLDGLTVSQKTGTWGGSSWSYFNFSSAVNSADSIFFNNNDNREAPRISPGRNYLLTFVPGSNTTSDIQDISKLYSPTGSLVNAFTGFSSGWINDTKFIFNRLDSVKCLHITCDKYYSAHVYSIDGQVSTGYIIPDSVAMGTKMVKTSTLNNAAVITDSEIYVNNSNVINIKTGKVLFAFDTIPPLSVPLGLDYIAYIKNNSLRIINWRLLSRKIWYKDGDKDGFGNPAIAQMLYKKPAGYVKDNTDCNDSDADLTPLNECIITSLQDSDLGVSVFPNPGNGVYYVKHNNDIVDLKVINSMGQTLHLSVVSNNDLYVIDLSEEPNDLYFLKIRTVHNNVNFKIIKH